MNLEKLKSLVKSYPDFPKPGVLFRDISPILADPEAFEFALFEMWNFIDQVVGGGDFKIAAIDSRGFIFGAATAYKFGVPFIMIRKAGKLPGDVATWAYNLEYGRDTIQVQLDAIKKGDRVVIIDDVLATGGTVQATASLLENIGTTVLACAFLLEIADLKGVKKLAGYQVKSLIRF